MHLLKSLAVAASAMLSIAAAQPLDLLFLSAPSIVTGVTAGKPFVVKYMAPQLAKPATIILRKGDPTNLQTIGTLTTLATGGSYTWTPATTLAPGNDYALEIRQGDENNYSNEFPLKKGSGAYSSWTTTTTTRTTRPHHLLTSSVVSRLGKPTAVPAINGTMFRTTPIRAPLPTTFAAIATGNLDVATNATQATPTLSQTYVPTAVVTVQTTTTAKPSKGAAAHHGGSALALAGGLAAFVLFV